MPETQTKQRGRPPKVEKVYAIVFGGGPPYEVEGLFSDKKKADEELQAYDYRFRVVEMEVK